MAKGFTPIIGLAVVVALALVAVFGAMSITNPAFAAVSQPAEGQLDERDYQPLMKKGDAPNVTVYKGQDDKTDSGNQITLDLSGYFTVGVNVASGIQYGTASYGLTGPDNGLVTNAEVTAEAIGSISNFDLTLDYAAGTSETITVTGTQNQTALADGTTIEETGGTNNCPSPAVWGGGSCTHTVTQEFTVNVVDVLLTASSDTPGKAARYTLKYKATSAVTPLDGKITLEMADFGVGSIDNDDIVVRAAGATPAFNEASNPNDLETDDEEIVIHLGDLNPTEGATRGIETDDVVTITIQASAGVTLPTEGGSFSWNVSGEGDTNKVKVNRKLTLDEEDGGLGDTIEATVKGFKNGTTVIVFLDQDENGKLGPGDDSLCFIIDLPSSDAGSCTFTVSHPAFEGGPNKLGAVDGLDQYHDTAHSFTLEQSISVTPAGGSPGELLLIQLVDFDEGAVTQVTLSAREVCGSMSTTSACGGSVDSTGSGSVSIAIPDWAKGGIQQLKVTVGSKSANTNVTITGPQVTVTPGSIVANQRISLVGVGFTAGSTISQVTANQISKIVIGGETIDWARINGNQPVNVDNGGNWSAAVDLPLSSATTAEGDRVIRVTDSRGRTGSVNVSVPARTITITPDSGRVGTIATVRGTNFPSKNDEGSSFNIAIVYDAGNNKTTQVSVIPDASGRFETQMRIPTTASIPSTNTVRAEFVDDGKIKVTTTVSHQVPEGAISLSSTSGAPGSTTTVSGEGFKSFVPVKSVMVGALEVTPSPRPSTDSQGMMSFDITIPGLDTGIQTVEVQVGQTTASTGFTVAESGVTAGDITPAAQAVENLGDNFVRAFHFNNDTKEWAFYDPMVAEDSTLQNFITGETYLMLVSSTTEVILNNKTRNLTCVGGNCWNQIVW